jgi:hypothetical protein
MREQLSWDAFRRKMFMAPVPVRLLFAPGASDRSMFMTRGATAFAL